MPKTTTHAVVSPTRITCVYATIASRFDMSAQTSVSSARPSGIVEPTGRCIHEFATMMKNAESQEPSAKIQIVAR